MRLFVALGLPPAAVTALAAFRDAADPAIWRPLDAAGFHVTLAFLGQRPATAADAVRGVLDRLGDQLSPALTLGAGLLLPERRPRALAVALEDADGALAALRCELVEELVAAGVCAPEARPFLPHVTVARLRPGARAPQRQAVSTPAPVAFSGGPVVLYRSHLGPAGARYEPLAVRTL